MQKLSRIHRDEVLSLIHRAPCPALSCRLLFVTFDLNDEVEYVADSTLRIGHTMVDAVDLGSRRKARHDNPVIRWNRMRGHGVEGHV